MRKASLLPLLLLPWTGLPLASAGEKGKPPYRLYAMDTGLRGPDMKSLEDRVLLLKKLGYAGIGYTFNAKELPRLLEMLDKHGLELSALYLAPRLDQKLDDLKGLLPLLKGRPTRLELAIQGKFKRADPEGDRLAEAMLKDLSDAVGDTGPVVSIYPHIGFYTAAEEDGLRLARKVGRKNVGTNSVRLDCCCQGRDWQGDGR